MQQLSLWWTENTLNCGRWRKTPRNKLHLYKLCCSYIGAFSCFQCFHFSPVNFVYFSSVFIVLPFRLYFYYAIRPTLLSFCEGLKLHKKKQFWGSFQMLQMQLTHSNIILIQNLNEMKKNKNGWWTTISNIKFVYIRSDAPNERNEGTKKENNASNLSALSKYITLLNIVYDVCCTLLRPQTSREHRQTKMKS